MPPLQTEPTGNAEYSWDEFDPEWYVDHNYRQIRDDDRRILQHVRDYFATLDDRPPGRGIDVGAGPNLYPSLAMLPFCREVTLWEHSSSNVAWLRREIEQLSPDWSWGEFWGMLSSRPAYRQVEDPAETLRERARVRKGDLFRLSRKEWDLGTMFFVAESITAKRGEFQQAVQHFIRALKPRAPFAAAFMKNSTGYTVGARRFPAVAVTEPDVKQCLTDLDCSIDELCPIPLVSPLREGYDGMILALGRAGGPRR